MSFEKETIERGRGDAALDKIKRALVDKGLWGRLKVRGGQTVLNFVSDRGERYASKVIFHAPDTNASNMTTAASGCVSPSRQAALYRELDRQIERQRARRLAAAERKLRIARYGAV